MPRGLSNTGSCADEESLVMRKECLASERRHARWLWADAGSATAGLYPGESNEMWATPPEFSAVGERWQARLNEGKALLIFAVPKTKFGDEIDIRHGTSTYSSGTLWFHSKTKNVKGLSVTLGSDSAIAYRVMFYEPGTYNMEHFFGLMHGSQFNEKMADRQPKPLSVGVVDFSGTYTYEWGSKTVWREPKYERRRSEQFVCSYVIAGTDQCISGNYVQGTQTVMTDAGGRDSIPVSEKRSAVHSHVMLKQPFASITVNAGEVIITDGIVGKLPNVDYADDACMPTADKKAVVSCVRSSRKRCQSISSASMPNN
ncbi:hypothetical protein [Diaphorobacter aerolatus]|uniref:Uncharacterized protein n=1 Tax=Diaphorobacter aerolatus TaxID=1288495 RepID=A0A7H0GL30_9BURK|nr:hypothetical protein [Diaphorobacter aerolatus]QNP48996.1 hypothetical protein H9K75_02140 [Diaphorobacter aerolatus]